MAFAEVTDDPAPSPPDAPPTFNQFWATTGLGAYGHQGAPHLDPEALGGVQRANLRPNWDGRGEIVHIYLLKWCRWERAVGRALGDEAPIEEILTSIPSTISGPIEDSHLRRCLSNKEGMGGEEKDQCKSLEGYLEGYCGVLPSVWHHNAMDL